MDGTFDILMRVVLSFTILLILVRIIGNKQLGQLNVFTYISGIVIGSMVSDIILHSDLKFLPSMLGVALWAGLAICVELIALKSIRIREILDSQPIILIKNGQIQLDALKKERLNIDDLTMMLRTNSVFAVADVNYAILEPNGDLSVLPKYNKRNVINEDIDLVPKKSEYFPTAIIIDGKIIMKNLKELNLDENWLNYALAKMNIKSADDVLYAEIQENGELYLQKAIRMG